MESNSSSVESSLIDRLQGRIGVGTVIALVLELAALLSVGVLLNNGIEPGVVGECTSWEP